MDGVTAGELPSSADPEVLTGMLIGSFYARYVGASGGVIRPGATGSSFI